MWESGSIDNDGGDIVWCPEGGRERYLGENRLDFGGNEDIFDERGDDGALAHPFITANTDPDSCHALSASLDHRLAPQKEDPGD